MMVHRRLPVGHRRFSERILRRKLSPDPSLARLSDKLAVRDVVVNRVGDRYLVPLYAVMDDATDFDFSVLPDAYVMKATHGSGWVRLVPDTREVGQNVLRHLATRWLAQSYYPKFRERHYRKIPPRIIFEALLLDNGLPAKDYKIHCFRKKGRLTQIVQLHTDRFSDHKVNFFDVDWHEIDMSHGYDKLDDAIPPPDELPELLRVADFLSRGINYVRIDLYVSGGRVYFGEYTFTPAAGLVRFHPRCVDRHWARLFDRDDR